MSIDDLLAHQARTARCSTCGAAIRWVHTETGRAMPLDAEPVDDGNVIFVGRNSTSDRGRTLPVVRVESQRPMFDDNQPRYRSHFATCPNADEHRRQR